MTKRTSTAMLISVLAICLSGCGADRSPGGTAPSSGPTTPTTPTPPAGPAYVLADATVSGVVYEDTPAGPVPIEGVLISNGEGPLRMEPQLTDANGFFSFRPVWVCPCAASFPIPAGMTYLIVRKDGYADPPELPPSVFRSHDTGYHDVMIDGDTHVRIRLVRR